MASLQERLSMPTKIKKQGQNPKIIPTKTTPSTTSLPSQPIKFSNDTKRLQLINSIRKASVGTQIKRVIDLLFEKRQALTPEQINEECYVDINSNKAVFDSLIKNLKVNYDGKRFSYKAKHNLKNKDQLLDLIRNRCDGIAIIDLKDAYPTVMKDLQSLKAAGQVWLLSNMDSREDIVYPNDPRVPIINVDNDIKQLFQGIELPRDMIDIEKDLQKNGMKPATNTAERKAQAEIHGIAFMKPNQPKKKGREISKIKNVTNIHLPELLQQLDALGK